jgi:hypothetical protein
VIISRLSCTACTHCCGLQIADQEYSNNDNASLVESCASRAPVRVFRGKVGEAGERLYIYEGLYRVVAHKRERSKDGPQVRRVGGGCARQTGTCVLV